MLSAKKIFKGVLATESHKISNVLVLLYKAISVIFSRIVLFANDVTSNNQLMHRLVSSLKEIAGKQDGTCVIRFNTANSICKGFKTTPLPQSYGKVATSLETHKLPMEIIR